MKTKKILILSLFLLQTLAWAGNPIIKNKGVNDPHIHIFNGKAYLSASHDTSIDNKGFVMEDWWIWSSDDLVNWQLESVVKPEDTYIGKPFASCWATDMAYRNGKYYLYFSEGNEQSGVMVADSPSGPWTDPLGKPLLTSDMTPTHEYDMGVFKDTSGDYYIVFGVWDYYIAKLNKDMISLAEEPRKITINNPRGPYNLDGNNTEKPTDDKPFMHVRNGKYYLSWGCFYAMANNPYGPFDYTGSVMDSTSFKEGLESPTWPTGPLQGRHGSFFEWNNQWYFAYCDISQTGNRYFRDTFISYVHYKDNGEMALVRVDGIGVGEYNSDNGVIEAEDYFKSSGISKKVSPQTGFILDDISNNDYVIYPNIDGLANKASIEFRVKANKKTTIEIRKDSPQGEMLTVCDIAADKNAVFENISVDIPLLNNKQSLCFVFKGKGKNLLQFDSFKFGYNQKAQVLGELKKWHTVSLVFDGPLSAEMNDDNPFLNYRMDVTFSNKNESFVVPGFYAADGNAAQTGATGGNKWMVRFTPNKTGQWDYNVLFKKGINVAVADDITGSQSAGFFDGATGSFQVGENDKTGKDNRAKGRLQYVGENYLKFKETGKYFIKLGVDAPENFLAYADFDATPNALGLRKTWEPHQNDFDAQASAYLWQGEKGKSLLGAINYLASEELNVFSFLTFNVDGDDRNVFPYLLKVDEETYTVYASNKKNIEAWETFFHKTRFDVSKLEQWERIFEYGEAKGMFLHFKTHETETDHLMDKGVFGTEGKLYYRELIARFGHHLVMNWNIGEENNQPIAEVVKVANYIKQLDAYHHHLVIHTFPNKDDRYADLIGDQSPLTGASLQLSAKDFKDVHPRVLKWRAKSDATGRKWALAVDEPGSAKFALLPDDEDAEHQLARSNALWGTLMAGGFGVEWYFGYASPNSDLTCQDFRSRDLFWDQNRHALHFFENDIPFHKMKPADELTSDSISYCLAQEGRVYVVYLHPGQQTTTLNIGNSGKEFSVRWFDPRNGGTLQKGSIEKLNATGTVKLGLAPKDTAMDWVVLVEAID